MTRIQPDLDCLYTFTAGTELVPALALADFDQTSYSLVVQGRCQDKNKVAGGFVAGTFIAPACRQQRRLCGSDSGEIQGVSGTRAP